MRMHMHMETHTFAQILRNIKFNISTYLQAGIPLSQLQAIDIKFCCFIMAYIQYMNIYQELLQHEHVVNPLVFI